MGWSIGYDSTWGRDIGYGVPAFCDHPGCDAKIDRGLAYVCCKQQPYGGDDGCGLYFCEKHRSWNGRCERCEVFATTVCDECFEEMEESLEDAKLLVCPSCDKTAPRTNEAPKDWPGHFAAKPDHPEWMRHKLTDASWATWRAENPADVERITTALAARPSPETSNQ